jgi:hypothetical protein
LLVASATGWRPDACSKSSSSVRPISTTSRLSAPSYRFALDANRTVPAWIDGVLWKAVYPDPAQRHEALSEFLHVLRHPRENYRDRSFTPLLERNPLLFWKSVSLIFAAATLLLLIGRFSGKFWSVFERRGYRFA